MSCINYIYYTYKFLKLKSFKINKNFKKTVELETNHKEVVLYVEKIIKGYL